MRTDNRIDLTPDPEVEDALRQLYASRESLVDLTSAERILDRARELHLDSPVAGEAPRRGRFAPWATIAATAVVLGGSLWAGGVLTGPSAPAHGSIQVAGPPAGPFDLPTTASEEESVAAEDAAREEAIQEQELVEARRLEEEARTKQQESLARQAGRGEWTGQFLSAAEVAEHVLERFEESRSVGKVISGSGERFPSLQPLERLAVESGGLRLDVTVEEAEADTNSCGMGYGAAVAESEHAVVVAAFAADSLRSNLNECVGGPHEGSRVVELHLGMPLGDRVLIDAATQEVVTSNN